MKAIWLAVLLVFSLDVVCRENEKLQLPKPEEVERIEISNTGRADWYKPAEEGKKQGLAEPLFHIWDDEGKEGFIDINGNVVLSGFDKVSGFSEGLAAVMIGNKWGYIDRTGKVVIEPRWQNNDDWPGVRVGAFHGGLASVTEYASWGVRDDSNYWTYKCGYIDKTGKYVIPPQLRQSCGPFSEGLAAVEVDFDGPEDTKDVGWLGYMDTKGNWAIPPKFIEGGTFHGGIALVSDGFDERSEFKRFLIDKKGRPVMGAKDCRWRYIFSEGLALAYSREKMLYDGFLNENCEYAFKFPPGVYADPNVSRFSEGRAVVFKKPGSPPREGDSSDDDKRIFGYIDTSGKVVIPFQFKYAVPFSEGLAAVVQKEGGNAYIDHTGKAVLKPAYGGNGSFHNGLAYQFLHMWTIGERKNGRNIYGYMNKQGKYVWLSPRAEVYLDKEWIKENYIGPRKK